MSSFVRPAEDWRILASSGKFCRSFPGKALIASMPDLSVEETASTQPTNEREVGPGEEAIAVKGASVDAEGTSVFEGVSVVAEETSLVAATSVGVPVVLSFMVGHWCQ